MPQRAIGYIIRERRRALGLTQEELAERISADDELLTQADVSRIETGAVKFPRPERLYRIAEALDLSLGDLLLVASGVDAEGQILVEDAAIDVALVTPERDTPDSLWMQATPHRLLLDALDQAVLVADPDGTIHYWNAAAEQLYGWTADEAIGHNAVDILVPEVAQDQAEAIMVQLASGHSWDGVFVVHKRDGSLFKAHITVSPVLDLEGSFVALISLSHAIE